jgi:hypothetical protein
MEMGLAGLGPFFAVDVHDPGTVPVPPWRPLRELVDDRRRLDERVSAVRRSLARGADRPVSEVGLRVAASVAHLGLVARLVAPAVGAAATGTTAVDLGDAWWQDRLGGPFPLSVALGVDRRAGLDLGPVAVLTEAVAAAYPVGGRVLWGNVASAVNSAARLTGRARPDLAAVVRGLADEVLADSRVEGGRLGSGPGFRRRSCCLIYRVYGSRRSVCGDCVLAG